MKQRKSNRPKGPPVKGLLLILPGSKPGSNLTIL